MFRRNREAPISPPDKKIIAEADEVLRQHRDTVARVKTILEREVERIDKYLTKKAGA